MAKNELVKTYSNGNIEYKTSNSSYTQLIFFIATPSSLIALLFSLVAAKHYYSSLLCIIALFLSLGTIVLGFLYPNSNKQRTKKETTFVIETIQSIVKQDAQERNLEIEKINFFIDTNSPNNNEEQYVLALTTDKIVLRYLVEELDCNDKGYIHKLIKRRPAICPDENLLHKIAPLSIWTKIKNSSFYTTLQTCVYILGFSLIGASPFIIIVLSNNKLWIVLLIFLPPFLAIFLLLFHEYIDAKLPKNKFGNFVRIILLLLNILFYKFASNALPFFTIILMAMSIFYLPFLLFYLSTLAIDYFLYDITTNTRLYLSLSLPFIFVYQQSKMIKRMLLKYSPLALNEHHFQYHMRELANFLYTKDNLNLFIYPSYFLLFLFSNFWRFQTNTDFINEDINSILIKSFLTYFAYTNMLDKKKKAQFSISQMLQLMRNISNASDQDEEWKAKRKGSRR
jgi:membrane protein